MKIQPITKAEFDRIEPSRRVIVHDYPHQFAILNLGEPLGCYGLSWRSSPIIQIKQLNPLSHPTSKSPHHRQFANLRTLG